MGLCQTVAEQAQKLGVIIHVDEPVTNITQEPTSSTVTVDTAQGSERKPGRYTAKRVVVAAPLCLVADKITFQPPLSPARQWLAQHITTVSWGLREKGDWFAYT